MQPLTPEEQKALAKSSMRLMDQWPLVLEVMNGVVAQTVAAGFTEDQARAIVAAMFSTSQPKA